jgi:pimeloyl-ACP methyl ester carboxylesterase
MTTKPTITRRRVLKGTGVALAALGVMSVTGTAAQAGEGKRAMSEQQKQPKPTIVLFHGAWADGSGWGKIIHELQEDGYSVVAPAVGLGALSADIAAARKFISDIQGPVLAVGHSYGGAVITGAASGLSNVTGLVYLAAFALDTNESLFGLVNQFGQQYGPAFAGQFFRPDGAFDNPQTLVYLDRANFGAAFVQDIEPERAAILGATQRPIAVAAFGEPLQVQPAWRSIRSWYQVSSQDRVLQPEAERFMAKRAGSEVIELESSHASPIAQPQAIAKLIKRAARA